MPLKLCWRSIRLLIEGVEFDSLQGYLLKNMKRLVVICEITGYDFHHKNVYPIKYESKEKFLIDFENKVLEYWLTYNDYAKAHKKWAQSEPFGTKRSDSQSKWDKWHQSEPKLNLSQMFCINGIEFDALEFIHGNEYKPPIVLTIDEWYNN